MIRAIVGISLASIFIGLTTTGIWLFFDQTQSTLIVLHVSFAMLFLLAAIWHLRNNLFSLLKYLEKTRTILIVILFSVFTASSIWGNKLDHLARWYAQFQQKSNIVESERLTIYHLSKEQNISVELRAGKHFWFPQIAVWTTDTADNYLETLFVTRSTAKGEFYGGRTKDNFKTFDKNQRREFNYRRVDALPHWGKKRGIQAADGRFAPTRAYPLPDGISGATPDGSLLVNSWTDQKKPFKVWVELNVAFDDNKYYSQYDMPDDTLYHSGTGLLGQPSVVYSVSINPQKSRRHYILEYAGHTHPSKYEPLTKGTFGLTTALEILDLGVVSLNDSIH